MVKEECLETIQQLTAEASNGYRQLLISGFARTDFKRLDKAVLQRLRQFGSVQNERLIVDIRKAYWQNLISDSSNLLADVRKRLHEKDREVEVFQALTEMLLPEPEGCRCAFIDALLTFYPQDRAHLDDILLHLETIAPSTFEPFSVEVRRAALSKWFYDPATLVLALTSDLQNPQVSLATCAALEGLAQNEPAGDREALLQAFACAYALDPPSLRRLLTVMRATGSRVLIVFNYEFMYRLLEGKLNTPRDLVAAVAESDKSRVTK